MAWQQGDRVMIGDLDMHQWDPEHKDQLREILLYERGVIEELCPPGTDNTPWAYIKLDKDPPGMNDLGYASNYYYFSQTDLRPEEIVITEDPELADILYA